MDRAERVRLSTARERVLHYLLAHGTATNHELWDIGGNAAVRRLWELDPELRQRGYQVEKVHEQGGRWRYTLVPATLRQGQLWEEDRCRSESSML